MIFLSEIDEIFLNSYEEKGSKIVKAILSKDNRAGVIAIPNFKLYYRDILTKIVMSQA